MNAPLSTKNKKLLRKVERMIMICLKTENKVMKENNFALYKEKMEHKFPDIKELSKSLFDMILENPANFEMARLKKMLHMLDRVDQGNISSERASVQVGQEYFDEYVKPNIDMSKEQ